MASGSSKGCTGYVGQVVTKNGYWAYRIVLLSGRLARSVEIDPQVSKLAFVILAGIFYRIYVEGHRVSVDGEYNGLRFTVDKDLSMA